MSTFKVAVSGDFRRPDGRPAFPDFDMSPLDAEPDLDWSWVGGEGTLTAAELEGFDALILLLPRIAPESFPQDGRLSVIARFGVGFDTVDVPACTARGCALVTTPDGVRRPVAVAILTLMLALTTKLKAKDRVTRQGPEGWAQRSAHMGVGLVGRTLGVLGMGNIGAEVFRLAAPLGMRLIACDPYVDPASARALGAELVDLETLFRESDVLSVSCPLNGETRHIVSAERLALMKPSAYLINTSRGPTVDEQALVRALHDGRIAGAGLDVFEDEPYPADHPLNAMDNVWLTPHALCWTDQCFAGIGAADVRAVLDVKQGRIPRGIVNQKITKDPAWQKKLKEYGARFAR